jgi:dTDP-4-amino-4,6-dideoxygalactose transaminase
MLPFSPPYINDDVIKEVTEALRSGWITTGPKTKLLEKTIAEYVGVDTVLCLNSATAGLELMLRWLGVNEADEVIVPCYTYAATANVVMHCQAKLVLVDVNAHDFNINLEKVKQAITSKTKVIMPVDFAGWPCDFAALHQLVNDENIKALYTPHTAEQKQLGRIMILSDAAHSLGALYQNKRTGKWADATVFSFHAVKNLTTAEGGAVCLTLPLPINNAAVYKTLYIKSLHGQTKDALAKTEKGAWEYDIIEPGYKCNMADIAAAIGLAQFKSYEAEVLPARKHIFDAYTNGLTSNAFIQTPLYHSEEKKSSYHVYPILIKGATMEQRNKIIQLIFDKDVSVNVHFKPIPLLGYYQSLGFNIENFPVSKQLWETEISLPVYFGLTAEQLQMVIDAVNQAVNKVMA